MEVKAEPQADVDPTFLEAVKKLREWALRRHAGISSAAAAARWFRIGEDDGKAFDRAALGQSTSRKAINEKLIEAQTGTPAEGEDKPTIGAVGDQIALTLQMDMLAVLERTRRMATMTPVRARILAASRMSGHGAARGVWTKCWLDHVVDITKRAKS